MDEQRARELYVSNKHEDHSRPDFKRQIDAKAAEDARYPALCKGVMECTKITYRNSVGDMDIPAYLFQPLAKRGARGHAAMIWVHAGVHGAETIVPAIKERQTSLAKVEAQIRTPRQAPPDLDKLRAALTQRAEAWKADLRAEPRSRGSSFAVWWAP